MNKLEDILNAVIEKWIKSVAQEMSIVQNQLTVHG